MGDDGGAKLEDVQRALGALVFDAGVRRLLKHPPPARQLHHHYHQGTGASTGIFATGDCLGTQVIATVFGPGVTQLYDTSTARGLVVTP